MTLQRSPECSLQSQQPFLVGQDVSIIRVILINNTFAISDQDQDQNPLKDKTRISTTQRDQEKNHYADLKETKNDEK